MDRLRFALAIGISAFLTFAIQPLVARTLLPAFGGGVGIWAACLFFFQTALLVGYAYAYALTRSLPLRRQGLVHLVLLAASLALMPVAAGTDNGATGEPTLAIIAVAARTVGLPCVLLGATSPLLQHWLGQTRPDSPYRFYALSNLGSLLGLVSYPFLIEPLMGLAAQRLAWSIAYAALS